MADPDESSPDLALLPALEELHLRHRGLTKPICASYAEAAGVCLSRHHQPPAPVEVHNGLVRSQRTLLWRAPDERALQAWANRDDATRDGAYSVAIAAVEVECGLVAIGRAETRTGADYWVATPDSPGDFEEALRLEVSGTDSGDANAIRARLRQKVRQVRGGSVDTPALACVVGFGALQVALEAVEAG